MAESSVITIQSTLRLLQEGGNRHEQEYEYHRRAGVNIRQGGLRFLQSCNGENTHWFRGMKVQIIAMLLTFLEVLLMFKVLKTNFSPFYFLFRKILAMHNLHSIGKF